jgi:hypothetical protein
MSEEYSAVPISYSGKRPKKKKRMTMADLPEEQKQFYVELDGRLYHRGQISPFVLERIDAGTHKMTIMPLTVISNHNDPSEIIAPTTAKKTFDIKPNKSSLRGNTDAN